jgi:uncharacterized membrane protein YdfJ with MMPL/SSD domain
MSQQPTPEMAAQEEMAAYKGQALAERDPVVAERKNQERAVEQEQSAQQLQLRGEEEKIKTQEEIRRARALERIKAAKEKQRSGR